MAKLPPRLQPLWPLAKRVHRFLTLVVGVLARRARPVLGDRAVPRGAVTSVRAWDAHPADGVVVHGWEPSRRLGRTPPEGSPAGHWVFSREDRDLEPERFCLEVPDGVVVGETGAVLSRSGLLDTSVSPYFGTASWREHPLHLRGRLPAVEHVVGDLLVLATRGSANYYHFVTDVLPRLGVAQDCVPGLAPDVPVLVPRERGWQRTLLEIAGLGDRVQVEDRADRSVRADRLLVPSLPNALESLPPSVGAWVREHLRPTAGADRPPTRLYVTRGQVPNTRRVVREAELLEGLLARGFQVVEPGSIGPQEQIDLFASAEVVVAPHGAALTNLLFCPPGVRILEMFTASYVNQCYWAVSESIPDARYTYLVDGDVAAHGPGDPMNTILADIAVDPQRVLAAVDALL